jgi:hypothetical protein
LHKSIITSRQSPGNSQANKPRSGFAGGASRRRFSSEQVTTIKTAHFSDFLPKPLNSAKNSKISPFRVGNQLGSPSFWLELAPYQGFIDLELGKFQK